MPRDKQKPRCDGYKYPKPHGGKTGQVPALLGFGHGFDDIVQPIKTELERHASFSNDGWDYEEPARNLGLERWQDRTRRY